MTSADGTRIAFQVDGKGPPLVLIDGGLAHRALGLSPGLRKTLNDRFSIYSYDRRGRGESGPGATPHTVDREVEDLSAVIGATGGRANVFGHSAGAALALEAARRGAPVLRMVCYEAPFILDASHPADDPDFLRHLQELVDNEQRGEAVALFFRLMEVPAPIRLLVRMLPLWKKLTAVAHTLPYEFALLTAFRQQAPLPVGYYDSVAVETLMISGDNSYQYMRNAQPLIAAALPHGRVKTLKGQGHDVKPKAVAPLIAAHLLSTS
ncbi:MAG: alpha/beta hydrolase [Aeromicrobium sp.]